MADEMDGKIKHVGGKIEEAAGDILGDRKMKRHGKLSKVEGEAEQDLDRATDAAEDAAARANAAKVAKDEDI
jgi:uncharacterized protein YjbJ (UPF0337 family)